MPSDSWVSAARSAFSPLARLSARSTLVLVALLLAVGPIADPAPAGAQSPPRGTITLTFQSPWVENSSVPVRLGLQVSSPLPVRDLLVSVALYTEPDQSALESRDEFDATLTGPPAGLNQLAYTTFPLRSVDRANGSVDVYVAGSDLPGKVPATVPDNRVFQLPCPARSGGCGGVYPLEVSLSDVLTGQPLDSFTTYVIVVPTAATNQQGLRFSFVAPLGAAPALSVTGAPEVSRGTLDEIYAIAGAEARWPKVPVTIDVYGQLLLALDRSAKRAKLLNTLAYGGLDTLVDGPFSAVDPTRLVRAGLAGDLESQMERSDSVFTRVLRTSGSQSVYIATLPLGARALEALADDGVKYVVMPQSNLASVTDGQPETVQWPYTLSAPFHVAGSKLDGLQGDPGLAAHLTGAGSPELRAQQLLADLAEIYFDSPDFPTARGVALVAPSTWGAQSRFLAATLRGLSTSPIIKTVPVTQIFATVPLGLCQVPPADVTGCSPALRAVVSPPSDTDGSVEPNQLTEARTRLGELSSVIPTDATILHALADAILLSETAGLSRKQRLAYLSAPLEKLREVGSQLGLPAGRTVTVTASSARVPIAITSGSRMPVHAILGISGTDLSSSPQLAVVLKRGTTSFIVRVHTRTSGDSSLQLQLFSPVGRIQLARVELTIRSTAISGVAIALTVGAAAFLLFWWFRSVSRRHRRRAKHVAGRPSSPEAEQAQEPAS